MFHRTKKEKALIWVDLLSHLCQMNVKRERFSLRNNHAMDDENIELTDTHI